MGYSKNSTRKYITINALKKAERSQITYQCTSMNHKTKNKPNQTLIEITEHK